MSYEILNKSTVINYLEKIQSVCDYLGYDEWCAEEIGDGNLNYVYIVKNIATQKGIIVKQAVPYLRCVGEDFPLSKDRMTYEIRALLELANICPQNIPTIFHTDEDMSVVVMQYLDNHIIMRKGLIQSIEYPYFVEHITTYLAHVLFKTSSLHLHSAQKRALMDKFNKNTELCKITEDFVFTFAFMEHKTNNDNVKNNQVAYDLFKDHEFKKDVLKLKYKFMTQTDTLLHGDLHTGSIMINKEETFIIDPEFAFFGPFGFDIGAIIGNLCASFVSHIIQDKHEEYRVWLLRTIKEILVKFEEKFLKLWSEHKESALRVDGFINDYYFEDFQKEFMLGVLRDSVGYAGCKLARRVFGIAGVEDIRGIKEEEIKKDAEALAIQLAKSFVKEAKHITCADNVIDIILSKTKGMK